MGKSNCSNVKEHEELAFEVKKYPCLYAKSIKEYKEKDSKLNAWKAIEETLGFTEGTAAKRFEVLKKKYSRKRQNLKKSARYGSGSKDAKRAQRDLDEYSFLAWLDKHTRYKKSKSNLEESVTLENTTNFSNPEDENLSDNEESTNEDEESADNLENPPISSKITGESLRSEKKNSVKEEELSKRKTANKRKAAAAGAELDVMNTMVKRQTPEDSSNCDDLFGKMIAGELRSFPEHMKFRVKHDLNNVIFNYKVRQMETGNGSRTNDGMVRGSSTSSKHASLPHENTSMSD